jgi:hypothetical protein
MAIITPVGKMNFDWSPEESTKVVKTASANGKTKTVTDKDLLYLAAKKVVQAQFDESEAAEEDKDESADESAVEDVVEVDIDDTDAEVEDEDAEVEVEIPDAADAGEESAIIDVQEAVAELVDKSEAADAVVDAVTVALDKVNQAVEEVRSAVGAAAGSEEVVSDDVAIDDIGGDVGGDDEVFEIEISDETECGVCGDEKPFGSDPDSCCKEEIGGEDIIQESDGVACASVKKALQKEAGADDFVKTSKISPTTRKKVLKFWKDDLGYAADYAKLMVTDYEK